MALARSRLPYGITVEDFCNAVKALPAVEHARTRSSEGGLLGMSCGLAVRQPDYASDLAYIEVSAFVKTGNIVHRHIGVWKIYPFEMF